MSIRIQRTLIALAASLAVLALPMVAVAQVPNVIPVQGTLYNTDGSPIDETLSVEFTLYADPGGATPVWSDVMNVRFVQGVFTAYLGDGDPLNAVIFRDYSQVYVGISIDGDSEMPLYALATAPYAGYAAFCGDADTVGGQTADDIIDAALAEGAGQFAPTVHEHDWTEITTGVPAGFADGVDDDTQLTEAEVDAMVADNGYLTSVSFSWGDLGGIPAGFADGVDNVLTESEVDAMVADNGFLTSVAWNQIGSIPAGFADNTDNDTQLNEGQVDDMVSDNGYLTSVAWGDIGGIPSGFSDGVDNDTNTQLTESQVDDMVSDNGYLTSVSWGAIGGIPAGFADGVDNDTNTQLSSTQVRGYMDGVAIETHSCSLSGYVNSWDNLLNYTCPSNQVMNGLYSVHDNGREDRQWRVRCCALRVQ